MLPAFQHLLPPCNKLWGASFPWLRCCFMEASGWPLGDVGHWKVRRPFCLVAPAPRPPTCLVEISYVPNLPGRRTPCRSAPEKQRPDHHWLCKLLRNCCSHSHSGIGDAGLHSSPLGQIQTTRPNLPRSLLRTPLGTNAVPPSLAAIQQAKRFLVRSHREGTSLTSWMSAFHMAVKCSRLSIVLFTLKFYKYSTMLHIAKAIH